MNFDQPPKIEQMGEGRRKLLALEKEGKYVFHGSPTEIQELEPRQAYAYDSASGTNENDGAPAVFATAFADAAIFRALINERNVKGDSESGWGLEDDGLHFKSTQNLVDAVRAGLRAKVYVFDKSQFGPDEGMQVRSHGKVIPVDVIEVAMDDLPDNIKIIS